VQPHSVDDPQPRLKHAFLEFHTALCNQGGEGLFKTPFPSTRGKALCSCIQAQVHAPDHSIPKSQVYSIALSRCGVAISGAISPVGGYIKFPVKLKLRAGTNGLQWCHALSGNTKWYSVWSNQSLAVIHHHFIVRNSIRCHKSIVDPPSKCTKKVQKKYKQLTFSKGDGTTGERPAPFKSRFKPMPPSNACRPAQEKGTTGPTPALRITFTRAPAHIEDSLRRRPPNLGPPRGATTCQHTNVHPLFDVTWHNHFEATHADADTQEHMEPLCCNTHQCITASEIMSLGSSWTRFNQHRFTRKGA
jgi:hypothetical protein